MQVEMTYVDNFLKFIFVSSCRHCNFMASNYQPITMQDFVHLHVHTQYSLLDGQASVARLVDKAIHRLLERIHARVLSRQPPPAVELRMRGVTVGGGCFRSHIMPAASCVVVPAVC